MELLLNYIHVCMCMFIFIFIFLFEHLLIKNIDVNKNRTVTRNPFISSKSTEIYSVCEIHNSIFLSFAQNINCEYNEADLTSTHILCFRAKIRKKHTRVLLQTLFSLVKCGCEGV